MKKRSIDGHHFSFHVLLPILNSDRAPRGELDDDGRLHSSFCPCSSELPNMIGILCKNSASPGSIITMVTSVKIPLSFFHSHSPTSIFGNFLFIKMHREAGSLSLAANPSLKIFC